MIIHCSRFLFIGDLRDSAKIIQFPIRQDPIINELVYFSNLLYFLFGKTQYSTTVFSYLFDSNFDFDLYTLGSQPANTWHARGTVPCTAEPHYLDLTVFFVVFIL